MKNKHLADMDREELKYYIFTLQEFSEQEKKDGITMSMIACKKGTTGPGLNSRNGGQNISRRCNGPHKNCASGSVTTK